MPDLKLDEAFASLETDRASATGLVVRRLLDPLSFTRVYAAMTVAEGHLGIVVRIGRNHAPVSTDLVQGEGFAIRTDIIKEDDPTKTSFGVFCTDVAYRDVFLCFARDLVPVLCGAPSEKVAVQHFLQRVSLWQQFFAQGHKPVLSLDEQCGLFAELVVLRDVILAALAPEQAVRAWKGPDGSPQDFRLPHCAVEVKCSRAKAGHRIPISNEQQLDGSTFERLVLVYLAVILGGSDCPSLTDLVEQLRDTLKGTPTALVLFNDGLLRSGWLDLYAEEYRQTHIHISSRHFFEVRDGFPRIVGSDLMPGVGDVRYSIDLSVIASFVVSEECVRNWVSK